MSDPALHLVKIPLLADKLAGLAKRRQIRIRDLDDGYLVHSLLTEVWQESAPAPFVLRGNGRTLDAWGYSRLEASQLIDHARAFGDPSILDALDGLERIFSKPMPCFAKDRRIGFLARVCPVARLARATNGHRVGAEVDVFLSRCFAAGPDVTVSREAVYRDWFTNTVREWLRRERAEFQMDDTATTGFTVLRVSVAAISRVRLMRRTQGDQRIAKSMERPDVRLEGDLLIEDGEVFLKFLSHGVGRHRAFGFGALMVVPPGTPHPRT